ncbi:hypothetical protein [Pseudomonas bohemica]|uniref:hypothetical protein n=1 Tax=Pseudomonas bohemica TaxID=2044872 RepID=UPI000DA605BA|nr:hypothetical protein [Pseudomonas bohemica]
MKTSIPRSPRPPRKIRPGYQAAHLHGSFNHGILHPAPQAVVADFLSRVAATEDSTERLAWAQRAIGALMAFTAINVGGCGTAFFHKDVFARLAALTGETPDQLVLMAGVVR